MTSHTSLINTRDSFCVPPQWTPFVPFVLLDSACDFLKERPDKVATLCKTWSDVKFWEHSTVGLLSANLHMLLPIQKEDHKTNLTPIVFKRFCNREKMTSVCLQMHHAMRYAFSSNPSEQSTPSTATKLSPIMLTPSSCSTTFATSTEKQIQSSRCSIDSIDDIECNASISTIDEVESDIADLDCSLTTAVAEKLRALMSKEEAQATAVMDLVCWIDNILINAQCTRGVVIVAFIYCERLVELNPMVMFTKENWKSTVFTSIMLASKVWDDISMLNKDFTYFVPFTLKQVNDWERAFLRGLKYNVQVDINQYERYFFELRNASNCLTDLSIPDIGKHTSQAFNMRFTTVKVRRHSSDSRSPSPSSTVSTMSMDASPDDFLKG